MKVYTTRQWHKDETFKAEPGQEVEDKIYYRMLNALPPKTIPIETLNRYGLNCTAGFLVGEVHEHDDQGKALYAAFGRTEEDNYYFLGYSHVKGVE